MNSATHKHTSDAELLERFYESRNNIWLGILLERYTMLLLGVSMKYLKNEEQAKDAVQQVFLKAINELHKYKVSYFKSWIYMIAKNHCLMQLRDKGRFTGDLHEQTLTAPEEQEEKNKVLEKETRLNNLETALKQLSTDQQLCVTLFYLQKMSYQEIAVQSNFTVLQVKSHIQNGKRNLKILMERMADKEKTN